jgi:P pilus assembly chaperone PapD
MIKRISAGLCLFLFIIMLSVSVHKQACASLMILPTNIVFEGRERYADVTLINNGLDTKNYLLEWTYHKMLPETGAYELLENLEEGEFDLSKYVVLSPKRVRLEPNAKQKIRIALRRPNDIAPGDYHVHLRFTAVPDEQEVESAVDNSDGPKAEASVKFVVSYSIPVILRVGESDAKAKLGQLSLERNQNSGLLDVLVPVERLSENPYSILGYLLVYHIAEDGNEELVGELSNANIFPEIDSRTFRAFLTKEITGGSLRVVLNEREKDNANMYVERIYPLQ